MSFETVCKDAAQQFLALTGSVKIISHYDSDGISGCALLSKTMHAIGRQYSSSIVQRMSESLCQELIHDPAEIIIFCDMGSSQLGLLKKYLHTKKVFILDHHIWNGEDTFVNLVHINPHDHAVDGSREISAAGVAYFFCKELSHSIDQCAFLPLVGAMGDMQGDKGFQGKNKEVLDFLVAQGKVRIEEKESEEEEPTYRLLFINDERINTLRKFSTLLNACGRLDKASLGIGASLLDPRSLEQASDYVYHYSQHITAGLTFFRDGKGKIIRGKGYTIFNAGESVEVGIIGVLMTIFSKEKDFEGQVLIGYTSDREMLKVSLRCGPPHHAKELIQQIVEPLGLAFGGHSNAAGASVPVSKEDAFLESCTHVLENKMLEETI